MRIKYFVLVVSMLFYGVAEAQDYQTEVGFFTSNEEEDNTNLELEITGLSITHYFDLVSTSKGPLAEAEFLSRTSNAYFSLITSFDFSVPGASFDGDGYIIGARYYVPRTDYFIGLGLLRSSVDFIGDYDRTIFELGLYLDERSGFLIEIVSGDLFGSDETGIAFDYKRLMKVAGKDINVEFRIENEEIDPDTNTDASLSGDYYIDTQFSVGAGFSVNSGDDASREGSTISFDFRYFFNPVASVEIEIEEFSADNAAGDDSSTVSIGVTGRF